MKTIKTIVTLNERATRKGTAKINTRQRDYYTGWVGGMIEKYRIETENDTSKLYHYGTLTATIDTNKKDVLYLYGESVSDSDSIGTFLESNGIDGYQFGYKPVNGGFYIIKDGVEI